MIYRSFELLNYKAIQNLKVELSGSNLVPIIGLNETGKSSILEAISLFDYKKIYASYSEIKNKFFEKDLNIEIKANILIKENDVINFEKLIERHIIEIEKDIKEKFRIELQNSSNYPFVNESPKKLDEVGFIIENFESLKIKIGDIYRKWFKEIKNKKDFSITRHIHASGWYYDCELSETSDLIVEQTIGHYNKNLSYELNEFKLKICFLKFLVDSLPVIIYIDDFKDKIPREINKETKEWYNYVNEMLKKHSEENIDIEKFYMKNDKEKRTLLKRVSRRLNNDLISKWDELHKDSQARKDFEKSEIFLDYSDGYFTFSISDNRKKIIDEYGDQETESVYFEVDQRSKGFQWFFNFFIKLYYNYKYNKEEYQSIILLDEPGVYLHSDFQKELLEILKKISEKNKIFYCTHLENLVNPNIISIKTIKIAIREDEAIKLVNYYDFPAKSRELGDLTPLINALKLSNYPYNYINEKLILVEGMTEVIFFKLLQEKEILDKEIKIIPSGGASNLNVLLSLIIGFSNKYVLILDSDSEGKKAFEKARIFFGEEESEKWILQEFENPEKNQLEDLYSENFKSVLLEKNNGNNLKSSLIEFYYNKKNIERRKKGLRELRKMYEEKTELYKLIERIKEILR